MRRMAATLTFKPVDTGTWSDLEAYPVDSDSPSYQFMGQRPMFQDLGFEYRHKAGPRRHVMVKRL